MDSPGLAKKTTCMHSFGVSLVRYSAVDAFVKLEKDKQIVAGPRALYKRIRDTLKI